ncbi:transposase [Nocardia goodfellowii]
MPRPRRSYSPEYRVEAAHRVIDSDRPVREIARELDVHENFCINGCGRNVAGWQRPGRPELGGGTRIVVVGNLFRWTSVRSWRGYGPRSSSRPPR